MGPVKVLGRAVQKVADSLMMTLIGNDAMYIYNVSWVCAAPGATVRARGCPAAQRAGALCRRAASEQSNVRPSAARWRDGSMARWRDGAMARWRDAWGGVPMLLRA